MPPPWESSYAACWMSSAELTIRPITFDWNTSSTRTSCGGEFSSHSGMVVTSSMTTNRQHPHSWIFTQTHASLAAVPLAQATGSTRPSRTRRPPFHSITFKDLFAITAAVNTWAASLDSRNILFHCDNLSIVHILSSSSKKCTYIITLLWFLFYICAHHNIVAIHIGGFDNH